MVSAFEKGDIFRCIDDRVGGVQSVLQKFLQSRAGEDDRVGALDGPHLAHGQGIVMEAGYGLRHQTGNRKARALTNPCGEFVDRQGGGSDLSRVLRGAAARDQKQAYNQ